MPGKSRLLTGVLKFLPAEGPTFPGVTGHVTGDGVFRHEEQCFAAGAEDTGHFLEGWQGMREIFENEAAGDGIEGPLMKGEMSNIRGGKPEPQVGTDPFPGADQHAPRKVTGNDGRVRGGDSQQMTDDLAGSTPQVKQLVTARDVVLAT